MISVLTQSPSSAPAPFSQPASPRVPDPFELSDIGGSIESFTSLYRSTGQSLRLNCIFPTCYPMDACYDLHDVHDMQSRSLLCLHSLVEKLRAAGVPTSYKLSPSVTPLSTCLVFAIPHDQDPSKAKMTVCDAVGSADLPRGKVLLFTIRDDQPALVIT